jgi:hypothetical protein
MFAEYPSLLSPSLHPLIRRKIANPTAAKLTAFDEEALQDWQTSVSAMLNKTAISCYNKQNRC